MDEEMLTVLRVFMNLALPLPEGRCALHLTYMRLAVRSPSSQPVMAWLILNEMPSEIHSPAIDVIINFQVLDWSIMKYKMWQFDLITTKEVHWMKQL